MWGSLVGGRKSAKQTAREGPPKAPCSPERKPPVPSRPSKVCRHIRIACEHFTGFARITAASLTLRPASQKAERKRLSRMSQDCLCEDSLTITPVTMLHL